MKFPFKKKCLPRKLLLGNLTEALGVCDCVGVCVAGDEGYAKGEDIPLSMDDNWRLALELSLSDILGVVKGY